jgi:predicted amino acid dehydrogenase
VTSSAYSEHPRCLKSADSAIHSIKTQYPQLGWEARTTWRRAHTLSIRDVSGARVATLQSPPMLVQRLRQVVKRAAHRTKCQSPSWLPLAKTFGIVLTRLTPHGEDKRHGLLSRYWE